MLHKTGTKMHRRLKVEEVGDFYHRRTKPLLRLRGNWLKEAGIIPNSYVTVTNPEAGVLQIEIEYKTPK